MAVYLYMSSSNDDNPFYCDDCVSRGCTCNWRYVKQEDNELDLPTTEDGPWKWVTQKETETMDEIKEGMYWTHLDDKGREYPCVEFMYDKDGFDKD